jgi:hypothetical protein
VTTEYFKKKKFACGRLPYSHPADQASGNTRFRIKSQRQCPAGAPGREFEGSASESGFPMGRVGDLGIAAGYPSAMKWMVGLAGSTPAAWNDGGCSRIGLWRRRPEWPLEAAVAAFRKRNRA